MVMPIPSDWDGETFCCTTIQWPASQEWWAILLGFVTTPTRGRFWDEETGSVIDAQAVGRQIEQLNNCLWEGFNMGCLEELTVQIECLCKAIYNTNSAGGSGGSGIYPQEFSSFSDNGSNFPTGYTDRAEYSDAKCNLAGLVISRFVSDLDNLKQINTSAYGAAGLAAGIGVLALTPIPGTQLFIIASAILSLASAGISTFVTATEELSTRVAAIDLCDLYSAPTSFVAAQNIEDWIAGGSYSNQTLTTELGQYFVTPDMTNILFDPLPEGINLDELEVQDCSGCDTACETIFSIERGVGPTSPNGSPLNFTAAFHSPTSCYYLWVTFGGNPDQAFKFDVSGWASCNPPDQFRIGYGDGLSGELYTADTAPDPDDCYSPEGGSPNTLGFIFSGNGPFTCTVTCCEV